MSVIIGSEEFEQLPSVSTLTAGTGEQAENLYNLLTKWGVQDWDVICCDITTSNTGRLKDTFVLLEQFLGKNKIYHLCRHHICRFVLKCVFKEKFGSTSGPNIPLFKNFKINNWNRLNANKCSPGIEIVHVYSVLLNVKDQILEFVQNTLKEKI